LSLVVASRSEPVLPLHRYRLAGELTEIRAGELAFSIEESSQLMERHSIALPADSLAFLTGRVDGWVAALRLAAISMTTHPDPALFVKTRGRRGQRRRGLPSGGGTQHLAGRHEVLPAATSILDQVNADLASELASAEPATDLPALAQANAPHPASWCGWYRYHPLLAEVLRLKLRRECPDLELGLAPAGRPMAPEEPDRRRGSAAGRSGGRLAACRPDSRG